MTNPIGVRMGASTRVLVERQALKEGKSICQYMRDVVQASVGLPAGIKEANRIAELQLEVEQLKKENQRLKYEGCFTQKTTADIAEGFEYGNVEVVPSLFLIAPKKQVQQVV